MQKVTSKKYYKVTFILINRELSVPSFTHLYFYLHVVHTLTRVSPIVWFKIFYEI